MDSQPASAAQHGQGSGPVFYPPLAVDPNIAHRVFFGAHSVYVSTDGMATWAQQTDQDLTSSGAFEGDICQTQDCALEDLEFGPEDGLRARTPCRPGRSR